MKETRDSSHFLSGGVSSSQQRECLAEAEVGGSWENHHPQTSLLGVSSKVYWTGPSILNLFQISGLEPDDLDSNQEKILSVAALCALRALQQQQLKFNEPLPEAGAALSV